MISRYLRVYKSLKQTSSFPNACAGIEFAGIEYDWIEFKHALHGPKG